MRHLKLYEDLFRKDYSDSQIMKAVKIIRDHAESIGNDPEGKEAYIFRVDGNMVFFKSLAKGVSIETLEAELPEMKKWGKEIVEQIESETSIFDIDYRTFIDRREDFLGIGIRFFFPFDISDDIAVAVEELKESLDLSEIEFDERNSKSSEEMALWVIKQVEKATELNVEEIDGMSNDAEFDLYMELSDGSEVHTFYRYSPYPNKERGTGFTQVKLTNKNGSFTKRDTDPGMDNILDAGEEVSGLLRVILKESNPTYVIQLPREHFGTSGYRYEIDNETKGYTQIDVEFESQEEAEKWIDSLYDSIKKKSQ